MSSEVNGLRPLGPRPEAVRYQMTRRARTFLDNSPSATPPHPHTRNPEHTLQRSLCPANPPDGRDGGDDRPMSSLHGLAGDRHKACDPTQHLQPRSDLVDCLPCQLCPQRDKKKQTSAASAASAASPASHGDWLIWSMLARGQTPVPDMDVAPPGSPPLWLWPRACPSWEILCALLCPRPLAFL
jgi:hypothetical protein